MEELSIKLRPHSDFTLAASLAAVFILFGALKILDMSPVYDFVAATTPPFKNELLFRGLGVAEVLMGVGLLVKPTRRYAAIAIIMHLLGTISVSLLSPDLIFSSETVVTFAGEFVFKNIVLIAAALHIFLSKD